VEKMAKKTPQRKTMHFQTMVQSELPRGRNGKHKGIVSIILRDLDNLNTGSALKVPLSELADSKDKVRSARRQRALQGVAEPHGRYSLAQLDMEHVARDFL